MERLVILLVFIFNFSFGGSIDDFVKKHSDSLKAQGIEKVFVHQYSLFNGRYNIPYNNEELRCDSVPTIIHIFWFYGNQWNCLRLDKCGLFQVIKLENSDFDDLTIDERIKLIKDSPHFTTYRLTKLYGDNREIVLVSGTQLTNDRNDTIKTFKKVNKAIKRLEDSNKFKRAL